MVVESTVVCVYGIAIVGILSCLPLDLRNDMINGQFELVRCLFGTGRKCAMVLACI